MRDLTGSIGGPISARQAVVLRQRPHQAHREEGADHALQQERRHQRVAVRGRSGAAGVQRLDDARRQRPPHLAGVAAAQARISTSTSSRSRTTTKAAARPRRLPKPPATADAYPQHLVQAGWQSPWTNRLLLDADVLEQRLRLRRPRARGQRDARPGARHRHRHPERHPVGDLPLDELEREPRVRAAVEGVRAPTSPAPTASRSATRASSRTRTTTTSPTTTTSRTRSATASRSR